jgi:hypothetical protein
VFDNSFANSAEAEILAFMDSQAHGMAIALARRS